MKLGFGVGITVFLFGSAAGSSFGVSAQMRPPRFPINSLPQGQNPIYILKGCV